MSDVNVISPAGEQGHISQDQLGEALKFGYRPATTQEVSHELFRQQYGEGFGNELKAAIEGGASGATFGLSRILENASGLTTPEAQAARKELNPWASGLGEAGGIGASLLVGGLPSLLAKGAGEIGAQVAGRTIEGAVAQKILGGMTSGVIEGAAYGAGQSVSESQLGDPTLNMQKVFTNIGLGALFGGAIGGGASALGASGAGAKLLNKFGRKVEEPLTSEVTGTGTTEATGTISPSGPMKMEGTIDFGMPDEKILKRAEVLNPKTPLKQNDLDWMKNPANSMPDAGGKPTVFQKIGTPEVPTLDPMATDQVYMGDVVKQGMKNLSAERSRLNQEADKALASTLMPNGEALSMTKRQYQGLFRDVISEIKGSKEFGLPIGKRAIQSLDQWAKAAKDMPDVIPATDLRDILQNIRNEGRIYVKGGGLKDDFVSKSLNKVQDTLDQYLKDNSLGYKEIQKEFAPFVRNSIELEDHLGWNWQRNDSDLVSDWVTNRVAKPFQSALPGTKADADLIRWFGKYAGTDLEKASKANFIFGKLNPQSAQAGQLGSWGARMAEGFDLLKHPTELPGKAVSGIAKIALTGEMPDFVVNAQAKHVQEILMGKTANKGASLASDFASKISQAMKTGSDLFKEDGSLRSMLVPGGVKAMQLLTSSDDVDHADRKIETLIALEKARNDADKRIESGVKNIFSGEKEPIEKVAKFVSEKTPQEHGDEYENIYKDLSALMNDPEKFSQRLTEHVHGLDDTAPDHAIALTTTASRAVNFLAQKFQIPERKALDQKFMPSKQELMQSAKYLKAVNDPMIALKQLRDGHVSRETMEVLNQVHPELYNHLKSRVLGGISDMQAKGKNIPMQKRLALGYFLNQDLDSSMTTPVIQKNQLALLGNRMKKPELGQPTGRSGAKHITLAERSLTPLQKSANR